MPLLEQGRLVADRWTALADADPVPESGAVIVTLKRWLAEREALSARGEPLGLAVPGDVKPALFTGDLARFAVIAVNFPKFRDGRGFTVARALREHHGYAGEIRATGHVLPDQYQHLTRCGFTTVEVPERANVETWAKSLTELSVVYQDAVRETSVSVLQRYLAG